MEKMHRVIYSHGLQVVTGQFTWAKGVRKEPGVIRRYLQSTATKHLPLFCGVPGHRKPWRRGAHYLQLYFRGEIVVPLSSVIFK